MRVSFNVTDSKRVKEFFSQELDFLDIYVSEKVVFIISNRRDIYSHMAFEVVSREDFKESVAFRIDRKEFLSMLSDGVVSFYVSPSGYVEAFFRSGDVTFSMSRPHQFSDMETIRAKLSILAANDKFNRMNLSVLQKYSGLFRTFPFINIYNGILYSYQDNVSLYCKVDCPNISLPSQSLNYLLKFSEGIYGYQNLIVGRGPNCVMIARQSRTDAESDIDYILSKGSSHRIIFDATPICALSRRCSNDAIATMNFRSETCVITKETRKFSTKFKIKEIVSAKDKKNSVSLDDFDFSDGGVVSEVDAAPKLVFPVKLFKDIVSTIPTRNHVVLLIKKKFIQMEIGKGLYLVTGRREDAS